MNGVLEALREIVLSGRGRVEYERTGCSRKRRKDDVRWDICKRIESFEADPVLNGSFGTLASTEGSSLKTLCDGITIAMEVRVQNAEEMI